LLTLEKVLILKSVSIFSEIPEEALLELATTLEERRIKTDETILSKGEIGTSIFIIVEGKVKVHDEEVVLATISVREVFGELAALDPEPRSASVTAMTDTYVFRIGQRLLYELISRHVEVARGIMKVLCRRIREADAQRVARDQQVYGFVAES
jgi:CRP-like cAMP-binding protein